MVALPIVGLASILALPDGNHFQFQLFDYDLVPVRVDSLSTVFGIIFHIAAILSVIYAFHIRDGVQQTAGLVYAGAAIGGAFAGDLITLFVYWELTAISSVFLIWASRTERSFHSGMRYLVIQVGSGVLLFAGALVHYAETGSILFDKMGIAGVGTILIFLAFGIKCAFPSPSTRSHAASPAPKC
jgi:multicomponent Na+:H+ antiporter subunit D